MGKPLQHTFSSFGITLQAGGGGLALLKLNSGLTDAEQAHNYHQVPAPADSSVFWGSSSPVLFFHAALSWKLPSSLYTYQLKNKKKKCVFTLWI